MEKVDEIVKEIGDKFQLLEEELKKQGIEKVEIKFPRGFLPKTQSYRSKLSFIEDDTLRRNLSYHLMLIDIYNWILNRFDIAFTGGEMLIKQAIFQFGLVSDALVQYVAEIKEPTPHERGFKGSLTVLVKHKIITEELRKNLEWLWEIRNKACHLDTLKEREFEKYSLKNYEKALSIWQELEEQLKSEGIRRYVP
jgi:uncharacterized protein YutE (UPF0331/DUF86 family)